MKSAVGYADLITDALSISALFSIGEAEAAWVNISFIGLETLLAVYASEKTLEQMLLTVTHLGIMVEGYISITTGTQTQGKTRHCPCPFLNIILIFFPFRVDDFLSRLY